jgi:hypothetical protein
MTAHEIVRVIGMPDTQEPYANPDYPGVPTGAFVERWICGCIATPAGPGSDLLRWQQCQTHREFGPNFRD